jgi:hypothetical protein
MLGFSAQPTGFNAAQLGLGKEINANAQCHQNANQNYSPVFVLQVVKSGKRLPFTCLSRFGAPEYQPDTINVGNDGNECEGDFCVKFRAWGGAGEQEAARDQNDQNGRDFDNKVNAFMQTNQYQLLSASFAKQCALEQSFGNHTSKPYTNKNDVHDEQQIFHV